MTGSTFAVPRGLQEIQNGGGKIVVLGGGFMGGPFAGLAKMAFPGAVVVVKEYNPQVAGNLNILYMSRSLDIRVSGTGSYDDCDGAGWVQSCVSEVPQIKRDSWEAVQRVIDTSTCFCADISSGFGWRDFEPYMKNPDFFGLVHGNSPFEIMPGMDYSLNDPRLNPIVSDLLRAMGKFPFPANGGTAALITNVVYTAVGCVYARLVQHEIATPAEIDAAWDQLTKIKLGQIMNGLNGFNIIPHMEAGIRRDVDPNFKLPGIFRMVGPIDQRGRPNPAGRIGWQLQKLSQPLDPAQALKIQIHLVTGLCVGIDRVLKGNIATPEVLDVANQVGISMPSVSDIARMVGGIEGVAAAVFNALTEHPEVHPGCELPEFLKPGASVQMPTEFPLVLREDRQVDGRGVAVLTLSNPLKMSPISSRAVKQLGKHYADCEADPGIETVVVTGATRHGGFQIFSSGADRGEIRKRKAEISKVAALIAEMKEVYYKRSGLTKPVIAAVNGLCGGGGFELAIACDGIVATEQALFMFPEVTIGILPGAGGTVALPLMVAPEHRKLAFTAIRTNQPIDGKSAMKYGIIQLTAHLAQLIDNAARLGLAMVDDKADRRKLDWDATWTMPANYSAVTTANNGSGGKTPVSKATDALLWAAFKAIGEAQGFQAKQDAETQFFLLALQSPDCDVLMAHQIDNKGQGEPTLTHSLGDLETQAPEAAALLSA